MDNQNKCEECYYYNELLIIRKAKLKRIGGFCCNDEAYPYCTRNRYYPKPCNRWKPKREQKEEIRSDVLKELKTMRKNLSDIALILKDGEINT